MHIHFLIPYVYTYTYTYRCIGILRKLLPTECWNHNADNKFSPASLVLCQFTTQSPASVFRHHGQSDSASHGLVR